MDYKLIIQSCDFCVRFES